MSVDGKPNTPTVWVFFGISTLGMLIFAALYFLNPKQSPVQETPKAIVQMVTNNVVQMVTNDIVKTNEVIKEVPANIPEEYVRAVIFMTWMTNADVIKQNRVLFGMDSVQTVYVIDDSVKQAISEDELRAKVELTLRRNNVTVDDRSQNILRVTVGGFWGDPPINQNQLTYSLVMSVTEYQTIVRSNQVHNAMVIPWTQSYFGFAGRDVASQGISESAEKLAEMFANDFLSANPKSK